MYDLTVTNPDGSAATLTEAFEVIDAEALRVTGVTPSSAENDEDTDVVIAGANFESPVRVWLGEVELDDPIVQSDAAVAVTVPAGFVPGVYDVTVENPDAESDTLEVGFEVLEPGSDDDADDDTGDDDDDDADDDTGDDDTGDDDTGDDDIW
ncbi:MAG: IPT/TIG domain-containing protein [Deltaproteobacteria bacterium]|nr:IPT/TIG domain-containing protein [Deltaproteobacteria bacterium]